jgi:uncharacterized repeat protein (TIGR01451 family)
MLGTSRNARVLRRLAVLATTLLLMLSIAPSVAAAGNGSWSINDQSVTEGNAGTKTMTFTITYNRQAGDNGDVRVNYATGGGTATGGGACGGAVDYVTTSGQAQVNSNWNQGPYTATFNVTVCGDTTVEPNETFNVTLSNPSSNTTIADGTGVGTITNDDTLIATTTTVTSSLNPSYVGQSVTFTATVSSGTGTVQFKDGAGNIGGAIAIAGGQATYTTAALTAGSHSITAVYSGDATHATSTSAVLTQVVNNLIATTTTVTSSLNPSVFGQSVTFTATVSSGTGTVQFRDGAGNIGGAIAIAGGQATYTTSALTVGSHSITAVYSGDATHATSTSAALTQVVNGLGTTTTVTSSLNPSYVGQSVTFTATVSSGAGTVQFKDGAGNLGAPVTIAGGQATYTTSALTVGSHSITAVYSGDATHATSTSAVLNQVVSNLIATTTTVTSSLNPSTVGQLVTFTATVSAGTGTVQFKDGAGNIGGAVTIVGGQATFTTSALAGGSHSITAVYSGDATHATSTSAVLTQVVNLAPLSVKMIKVICPSYSVVPANLNADNVDATGGHWSELASGYLAKPVDPSRDIPAVCQPVAGWTWDFRNAQGATTNISTYTTGADGSITVQLNPTELALARGGGLWVQEEFQAGAAFGSIRCYNDVLNGDNLENIQGVDSAISEIYCVAYNVATPSLIISKTPSSGTYDHVGQVITYTYTLTNTGTVPVFGPYSVIDDNVDAAPVCSATPATLDPTQSVTCTADRTVTQLDLDAGSITNIASGHAHFANGSVDSTVDASVTVVTLPLPGLSLSKTADVASYTSIGDVINYSYTVTNNGNVTLSGPFTLTDTNPSATCDPVATLAPGASYSCTAKTTIVQSDIDNGVVVNVAQAGATYLSAPVPSNVVIVPVWAAVRIPGIDVVKTADRTSFDTVGQVINYTITLTNTGNVTLTSAGISDPAVSDLNCETPATLAPGAHLTCTASYTVGQADIDAGSVTNVATGVAWFGGASTGDGDGVVTPAVQNAHLTTVKKAGEASFSAVGDVIHYSIALTNDGNVTLGSPSVSDPTVGDLDCGTLPASLAPGAEIDCTASHTISQADLDAGSVSNTATGHGFLGILPVSSDPSTAVVNATGTNPSLSVNKTVDIPFYDTVGQVLSYTVTVTNNGNVTITNLHVYDVAVSDLSCSIPATLAPGDHFDCTASHTVNQGDIDGGMVGNYAQAVGEFNGNAVQGANGVSSQATQKPSVGMSKETTTATFSAVGQHIPYTFHLANTGNVTLSTPSVTDPMVSNLDCGTVPATLAPGEFIDCTASYDVTQADLDAGSITNTATGQAFFGTTPVTSTNSVTIPADQRPAVSLTKVPSSPTYGTVGQVIGYTITFTNTGNVTLTSPSVTDPSVTDLACGTLPATLAAGAHITCTASHTIVQADIDAGSVSNTATASAAFGKPLSVDATSVVTASQTPSIAIVKTASRSTYNAAGQVIDYTITFTNDGNVVVTNPAVTDAFVSNLDCGTVPASLAPGAHFDCTASYTVTQADLDEGTTIINKADASAAFGTTPLTASDSVQTAAAQNPSLHITKVADPTTYSAVDQVIDYTIVLTNDGNVTLTNPTVADPSVSNLGCGTLPSTLAPGDHIDCTASHTVSQADMDTGHFSNTVTGSATFGEGPLTTTATVQVSNSINPQLTIHKTSTTVSFAAVGDPIAYSYVLTNTGNVTLAGPFTVTDDKVTVACPDDTTLAPGAHITCTATYTVVQADIDAGHVTNVATAHGAFGGDPVDSTQTNLTVNIQGIEPTPFESVGGATAPATSTAANTSGDAGVPLFALLICLAFGALALVTVQAQRSGIRR